MTKRKRLIWKTLLFCSVPLLIAAIVLLTTQQSEDAPYIAGHEKEGITRNLDRSLEEGLSGIRFTEVTQEAGLDFDHFPFERTSQLPEDMGSGAAWGDYDGDGLPDLFLVNFAAPLFFSDEEMASSGATDRLYRNLGDGTFQDVTASAGVGKAHRGMGASWGDYDTDGDLDLIVTSWGNNTLWRNAGDGTFTDATAQSGIAGQGFWAGASWSDFDVDGDLDLYICGYVQYVPEKPGSPATQRGEAQYPFTLNPSSYPPHVNQFYVNRGDGTFREGAAEAGILGDLGRSLSCAWTDFDGDGRPDLYITNDVSDNVMYRNKGDGTFQDISYQALVADYRGSMGIAVGDWDGDLDLDFFVTHWLAQENALYSNLSSEIDESGDAQELFFGDDADGVGLGQIALDLIGWGTAFRDMDNDGWLDLFVANGSTFQRRDNPKLLVPMDPHVFWNRGAKQGFFEVGAEAGIRTDPPGGGRGVAMADYDMDGDQDVVVLRHSGKARLLRNDSRAGNWVTLRLQAHSGHPSGLGAYLVLYAGERAFAMEAGAGPSYLSQNHTDIPVGLGSAEHIDSVLVRWPGGVRETHRNLSINTLWRLEEGQEPTVIHSLPVSADQGGGSSFSRRSTMSEHAVVSDLSSELTREDKLRFWELNKKAGRLFGEGQWRETIVVFEEMMEINPDHLDAIYYCGNCFLELGEFANAKQCWERLLEINPLSTRALVQIGVLQTIPEAGVLFDLEHAAQSFEKAHQQNPEQSRPLVLWGEAALAQHRVEMAEDLLKKAYDMNSQATSAFYLSGYIAWKRGDTARAGELLRRAQSSLEAQKPVRGVLGEGDTRSEEMDVARRKAEGRRPFARSLDLLRAAEADVDLDTAYSWVSRDLSRFP